MSTKRKPMRARRAMPDKPAPTDNQIEEAMLAFERLKVRYFLTMLGENEYVVRISPEQFGDVPPDSITIHRFTTEADARRWREREIIRLAITAGMRAKP